MDSYFLRLNPQTPGDIQRFDPILYIPLDVGNPLSANSDIHASIVKTSSVSAYGRDSIMITAPGITSGVEWPAVIRPDILIPLHSNRKYQLCFSFWVKSTLSGAAPKVSFNYLKDGVFTLQNFFPPSGTYDWTEFNYNRTIDGNINNNFNMSFRIYGLGTSASGNILYSGIRVKVMEYDKLLPTVDPNYIPPNTVFRGFNFHPLSDKNQFLAAKRRYNSNIIRFQFFPSSYDPVSAYNPNWSNGNFIEIPDSISARNAFESWWNYRIQLLDKVCEYAIQTDSKVNICIMDYYGSRNKYINMIGYYNDYMYNYYITKCKDLAIRYKDNIAVDSIELMNEPYYWWDNISAIGPLDKNYYTTQKEAAYEIRRIDSNRKLIIAAPLLSDPAGIRFLQPLGIDNIEYNFHGYQPGEYTGASNTSGVIYLSSTINGKLFDKNYMYDLYKPVRDFQLSYKVPIRVSEWSPMRWHINGRQYFKDQMDIFEEYGWNWEYFEWCDTNIATLQPYDQQWFSLDHEDLPMASTGVSSLSGTGRASEVILKMALNKSPYTSGQQLPKPPQNLAVSRPYGNTYSINFIQPLCYASAYNISYKDTLGSNWNLLSTVTPTYPDSYYVSAILNINNSYDFKVDLVNSYGSSGTYITQNISASYLIGNSSISAARAYSLRKVNPNYSGYAIVVRRGSDNATSSIGFDDNGDLDLVTLSAFIGSSSATISTWYDQMGNVNMTNANNASQPLIASAGVIIKDTNNKPALKFTGAEYLQNNFPFLYQQGSMGVAGVVRANNPVSGAYFLEEGHASSGNPTYSLRAGKTYPQIIGAQLRNDQPSTKFDANLSATYSGFDGNLNQFVMLDTGTSVLGYINENMYTYFASYSRGSTLTTNRQTIGTNANTGGAKYTGLIQELILYSSGIMLATDITNISKNQKYYYGIS